MTAKFNSQEPAYLYAQNLDNSGHSLCWRSDAIGEYQELDYVDPQRAAVLRTIDRVRNNGRQWPVGSESIECMVTYQGDCLIEIKPLTRDISGRIAPVILLFNVFSNRRKDVARMLLDCENLMHRELSVEHRYEISHLDRVMAWPRVIIALHIVIYSRRYWSD